MTVLIVHHIGGLLGRRSWCAWRLHDPETWSYGRTARQAQRRVDAQPVRRPAPPGAPIRPNPTVTTGGPRRPRRSGGNRGPR